MLGATYNAQKNASIIYLSLRTTGIIIIIAIIHTEKFAVHNASVGLAQARPKYFVPLLLASGCEMYIYYMCIL